MDLSSVPHCPRHGAMTRLDAPAGEARARFECHTGTCRTAAVVPVAMLAARRTLVPT